MKIKRWFLEKKITVLYYIFRMIPIKKNKVVFCNYVGKGYGCNPKYIAEELMRRSDQWDIVWIVKDLSSQFPEKIRTAGWDSVKAIYELATAAVWVDNQRKLSYHKKRKKQLFIETWHGGAGPIKKIGADNPSNYNDKAYEKTSKHMDKIVNFMVSNGKLRTQIYKTAFLYTGEILECGAPRNDILVKGYEALRPKVYSFFQLPKERKTVLYAPTYRKGRGIDSYQLDAEQILQALTQRFGGEWTLLLRLHPTMTLQSEKFSYDHNVLNASKYDDAQELLAASDVLISDYSSVISEFAITRKPIFLYATDIDNYGKERDFYIDYYKLPFSVSQNNDELVKNISIYRDDLYQKKLTEYFETIGSCEYGNAAQTVVDRIEDWIKK